MADLYTKRGKPLTVSGDDVFDRSGRHVGRRQGDKIYGPDGSYAATVVGDTAVYRRSDSAAGGEPFLPRHRVGTAEANRIGSTIMGAEPFE